MNNCEVEDCNIGYLSSNFATNCSALNCIYYGFSIPGNNSIFTDCTVDGTQYDDGFYFSSSATGCVITNCHATNINQCGFYCYNAGGITFINCTAVNQCLAWGGDCTGHRCLV